MSFAVAGAPEGARALAFRCLPPPPEIAKLPFEIVSVPSGFGVLSEVETPLKLPFVAYAVNGDVAFAPRLARSNTIAPAPSAQSVTVPAILIFPGVAVSASAPRIVPPDHYRERNAWPLAHRAQYLLGTAMSVGAPLRSA